MSEWPGPELARALASAMACAAAADGLEATMRLLRAETARVRDSESKLNIVRLELLHVERAYRMAMDNQYDTQTHVDQLRVQVCHKHDALHEAHDAHELMRRDSGEVTRRAMNALREAHPSVSHSAVCGMVREVTGETIPSRGHSCTAATEAEIVQKWVDRQAYLTARAEAVFKVSPTERSGQELRAAQLALNELSDEYMRLKDLAYREQQCADEGLRASAAESGKTTEIHRRM
jgi:hypothetical protein